MDICVVSSALDSINKTLTFLYKISCGHMFLFLVSTYLLVQTTQFVLNTIMGIPVKKLTFLKVFLSLSQPFNVLLLVAYHLFHIYQQ